jgi:NADPH-dependent glutamate synthase beta subunit-like oxidoreductase
MLRVGIPAYRLPRKILDAQIERIAALGVNIRCSARVGRDVTWAKLTHDYAAIFIATGAHISRPSGLSLPNSEALCSGLEFLRRVNRGERPRTGRRVIVIGGGNTAIDCARTAFRLGASVTVVYRRTRAEMPAIAQEIEEAELEGIRFEFLAAPTALRASTSGVELTCSRMCLGEPDASGRRKPVPAGEPPFTFEVDTIITAIGEDAELTILPEEITNGESPITDEWGCSRIANIFLGGDVANETRTVASALGAGKRAAVGIDKYLRSCRGIGFAADLFEQLSLGGEGAVSMTRWTGTDPVKRVAPWNDVVGFEDINLNHFARAQRLQEKHSHRMTIDAEVNLGMTAETALREAARCFECGVCNDCEICLIYCGDVAIVRSQNGGHFDIRLDYCKGCGICAAECPRGAIVMVPAGEEWSAASGRLRSDADVPGTQEGL